MKTRILFTLALLLSLGLGAQDFKGATVTVTLENVLNDQGDILAALHTDQTFMKGAGIKNFKAGASPGSLTFTFENVTPGTYAVSVLHDLNSNERMDFESNGMPSEPYGMSGNDMAMGPPTFGGAAFEVGWDDVELHIRF
ncbi:MULTISPECIES: DUF2141 domain-containing protein [Robiginitalea]|uniref:DUF2141 domain-containing protein n=1 Tax=Robiginitalea biformata (strain ATCC BAA-864 / DSM 15991 / KCTC 12146 / HTCC2501) TaxID=313596 RepID=A4CNT1_ROBBH|nr:MULTISPECIES: DUF2141 domain-containing protein [Robiginitalea]EAR14548.1 hypothetical protein RB2501_00691 [Robiginitalea biformata HTCC2501]MDC6354969.1 DUF2141 domain-containing protein [Robiginitalea sp. PM2]MDC6375235.1 DUF2141 domain-containing protein [Robiginitalea sp. SP8]